MTAMTPLALFGVVPAILILFAVVPPRRAMITSFLFAWMFLPSTGYALSGLPDYTKVTAASLGVLLAVAVFDGGRLRSLRPHWLDVPMLVWCLCPFASSVANELGSYDGISAVVDQVINWGVPYFLGRIYLRDLQALRELAVWVFIGALIYLPLCLWEVRMSPQLNRIAYGFGGGGIEYLSELGKWGSRPRVFMQNRLQLGMFMTSASLLGIWLWTSGTLRRIGGVTIGPLVCVLVGTTLLCKNLGALILLGLGIMVLVAMRRLRSMFALYLLMAGIPLYMTVRSTGVWSGDGMVRAVSAIHEGRAGSLNTRFVMENRLVAKALERPVLGWGRWGRGRVFNESGKDITLSDGLWVITLGRSGLVGLVFLTGSMLLPVIEVLRHGSRAGWVTPELAPIAALATLVVLHMIDNLMNAMLNPIFVIALGGLTTISFVSSGVDRRLECRPVVKPMGSIGFRGPGAVRG